MATYREPWDGPAPWRSLADVLREEEAQREEERRARGETAVGVDEATSCRTCGGGVRPDEGHHVGLWREHDACADPVAVLAGLTGDRHVEAVEAAEVWQRLGGVPQYYRVPGALPGAPTARGRRKSPAGAWSFLRDDDREKLRAALAEVRRPPQVRHPRRSGLGACAWCGRARSATWVKAGGWKWPDGAPAVLCDVCVVAWRAAGRAPQWQRERWSGRVVALLVGADVHNSQVGWGALNPPVYVEHLDADRKGVDQPWAWVPREAVHEARIVTLGPLPRLATDATVGAVAAAAYRRRIADAVAQREAKEEAARVVRW